MQRRCGVSLLARFPVVSLAAACLTSCADLVAVDSSRVMIEITTAQRVMTDVGFWATEIAYAVTNGSDRSIYIKTCDRWADVAVERRVGPVWVTYVESLCPPPLVEVIQLVPDGQYTGYARVFESGLYRIIFRYANQEVGPVVELVSAKFRIE